MAVPDFVHLRTHSHYSLLSAPAQTSQLVAAARADEQRALALTDSGNLYGAIEFYKRCRSAELRPILGMSAHCAGRTRHAPTAADNPTSQLTLLAADADGFDSLRRLSSYGFLEGFYYRPRIDRELLQRHGRGLIVLTGDLSGDVCRHLQAGDTAAACRTVGELEEMVGKGNVYLEIMDTGVEAQKRVNPLLVEMHRRLGTPLVATNDVHYVAPGDWVAQDIMTCIRSGKVVNDPQRFRMPSRELYLKTREQMATLFRELPQAIEATVAIAERCNVEIKFHDYHLPIFDTGSDEHPDDMFERLCYEGAKRRYGEITDAVRARLEYEIGVIRQLGFCSYFLITADFIRHARAQGIPVGPGRGSAAGAMVAYVLEITNLDPLRYNLIFERFLNVARVSMPDIDVDFCGNRRDEVIDYVRTKYGKDCVSQIVTFGTMASRGVLRDVGRVLEFDLGVIDKIAKKVPQGPGASLRAALESNPELQSIRDESPANRRLFELGVKLEGLARHTSVHAAGVVVADRPLIDYVPLCKNGDDITTQWQMTELEEVGLLKVDFLGLKTLTILTEACRLIHETHGERIDLEAIPLDDRPTYELMTRGDTLGVFQLESSGMRELLGQLKPDVFEDVIAVLALYRPGPLTSGMVSMFVKRKHGEEPIVYPHDDTREILEETYGVIVYQEQVMRISNTIAGFSMSEADSLRKAMGKKKPEVMAKFKEKFVDGAVARGHDAKWARELFETIEFFAGYGFNKSHSAAYALITYQTAWLKAHYPIEFVAANMTVESAHSDKLKEYVDYARHVGIRILPPDVTRSRAWFSVEDGEIRYGLGAIKGVGTRLAENIGAERDGHGPYASLEDLCSRLDAQILNRGALEALTKAGSFDTLEPSRRATMEGLEAALRASATAREDRRRGQGSLFGFGEAPPAPSAAKDGAAPLEWSDAERLAYEKEALGFYLSGHPFERRGRFLARLAGNDSATVRGLPNGESVRVAGMLTGVQTIVVRNGRNAGKKMARCTLEDLEGSLKVVVFARTYDELRDKLVDDSIVFVTGRIEVPEDAEEISLRADAIDSAEEVIGREVHGLIVRLDAARAEERVLEAIERATQRSRGEQRLMLDVEHSGQLHRIRTDQRFSVAVRDALLDDLAALVGPRNLLFTRR
ncbi:MAG: DNA polymerase III subunit alpha [Planctomycetes bacterium]|nr:DNA polymerase III subunit alpha [Planctomycetota bacterium]